VLRIGFICPTYAAKRLDSYTRLALLSFFETTPGGVAIVVDDGSAAWSEEYEQSLRDIADNYGHGAIHFHHFPKAGGLTRSWNYGLHKAAKLDLDYAIAGNNDVVFTAKWYEGMVHALANGYSLVGPLSNAPGITAKGQQELVRYLPHFSLTDDRLLLDKAADELNRNRLGTVVDSQVNGFFQMATMGEWKRGMFDDNNFYRPKNTHTSRGRRNPTPLMTLNEDELQGRWGRKGMKSAIVLSSFIFHYRAVSRGEKYKRGSWYRQK
jgi:glycosyltransferase involved in cell wall biosynthesis